MKKSMAMALGIASLMAMSEKGINDLDLNPPKIIKRYRSSVELTKAQLKRRAKEKRAKLSRKINRL